jgi:DNA invertase Pin-like site-specific DNA recombinase
VIIEAACRLARSLMTQELGILALVSRGVRVLTASGDDLTDDSDPSRTMMHLIAGTFYQYEKARLVAKLKAARDRKRAESGKADGRKRCIDVNPLVQEAKRLVACHCGPTGHCARSPSSLRSWPTATSAAQCSRRRRSRQCSPSSRGGRC